MMSPSILTIDDEPKWLAFIREQLGKMFNVEVASNLEATLSLLNKKTFDLIIASSRRQDVLKAINENYPQERVIVATGQPTTKEAIETYRLGALDYFPKDFRAEVISAKVQEALQKPHKPTV
jgi:DNA-binding NtrC family response regulator